MADLAVRERRAPWLGIGVSGEWQSSAEALAAAGLDFDVRQEQLFWNKQAEPGIVFEEPAPMFGNVRCSDEKLLGCVTPQYNVLQNADAFALLDPFLENGVITHAGMTQDGLVFMVAELMTRGIGGEEYQINLMCTNSFNAKYPCQIIMTPVRIICQNMYRGLTKDRVFLAKHTLTASDKLRQIANSSIVDRQLLTFSEIIEGSQAKKLTLKQVQNLVALLFPYPKPGAREEVFKLKADEQREKFMDRYYDAPDNRDHHGTAFAFVNAYMDYLSHRDPVRNTSVPWEDRRLQGIVSGLDIDRNILRRAVA